MFLCRATFLLDARRCRCRCRRRRRQRLAAATRTHPVTPSSSPTSRPSTASFRSIVRRYDADDNAPAAIFAFDAQPHLPRSSVFVCTQTPTPTGHTAHATRATVSKLTTQRHGATLIVCVGSHANAKSIARLAPSTAKL